jgi:hypothetical protein
VSQGPEQGAPSGPVVDPPSAGSHQGWTIGERLAFLQGMVSEYKEHTPSFEQMRLEVTGAANRIETAMKKSLDERGLPTPVRMLGWLLGAVVAIVATSLGVGWKLNQEISAFELQTHDLERDVLDLNKRVEALSQKVHP